MLDINVFKVTWLAHSGSQTVQIAFVHAEAYKHRGQTARYFCGKAWKVNVFDLQKIASTLERSIMFKLCKEAVWGKSLEKCNSVKAYNEKSSL